MMKRSGPEDRPTELPAQPADPFEILASLLSEYAKTLPVYSRQLVRRRPGDAATRRILQSLAAAIDENEGNPLPAAAEWWRQWSAGVTGEERFRRLDLLLDRLDSCYSTRTLIRVRVPEGQLVLGRRWWNLVGRCQPKSGRGTLDSAPAFAIESPFPHLRLVAMGKAEWLGDGSTRAGFEPAMRAGKLRIGLCSLSGQARTRFVGTEVLDTERGVYGFRAAQGRSAIRTDVNGEGESRYLEELAQSVAWARREGIHILCFPELSVCGAGRERLRAAIRADPGELCLVVPGSYHDEVQRGGAWVNASPFWLVTSDGITEVATFEKGETFFFRTPEAPADDSVRDAWLKAEAAGCEWLREDIRPGGEIRALVTPVGVVGVAICKDELVSSPLMLRYRQVVDHLLVVAMNDSSAAWFWSKAEEAARTFGSATFLTNAAQVVKPDDTDVDVVLWRVPRLPRLDCRVRYRRAVPCPEPRDAKYRQLPPDGRVRFEVEIPAHLRAL